MVGNRVATLSPTRAKARFGVAYVRAVCSQAGVGFAETSPDEDVLAVDGDVQFSEASVRIQVKCSGQFKINGGSTATWQAEPHWREMWRNSIHPVYFVLVIVDPDEQQNWLDHRDDGTLHRAAAFWVRVDGLMENQNITVPKHQRLTASTLGVWKAELLSGYTGSTR
jgi:hypothetical protein